MLKLNLFFTCVSLNSKQNKMKTKLESTMEIDALMQKCGRCLKGKNCGHQKEKKDILDNYDEEVRKREKMLKKELLLKKMKK